MNQPNVARRERERERVPFCRAILKRTITLTSTEANRVYLRCYHVVSKNLYALDVICNALLPPEAAEKTAQTLDSMFAEHRNELVAEQARIMKLYEALGITSDDAQFSFQKQYTAEYSTPLAVRFLELTELLDELMKKVYVIRAYGAIQTRNASVRTYQWQQRLIKFSGKLRHLTDEMWREIKGRNKNAGDTTEEAQEAVAAVQDMMEESAAEAAETVSSEDNAGDDASIQSDEPGTSPPDAPANDTKLRRLRRVPAKTSTATA